MRQDLQLFQEHGYCLTKIVSGTNKLAQSVIIELFTRSESVKYQPNRGCDFVDRLQLGLSEYDIVIAFTSARSKIRNILREKEDINTPEDEKFATMRLDGIILEDDTIQLVVTVVSKAKTGVKITTPKLQIFKDSYAG